MQSQNQMDIVQPLSTAAEDLGGEDRGQVYLEERRETLFHRHDNPECNDDLKENSI